MSSQKIKRRPGHVFWLFGLSGAGKSTLAEQLEHFFHSQKHTAVLMLDGDRLRNGLCRGLGFSDADRSENLRRAAEVARLGVESGLVVIAAFITPLEIQRAQAEMIIGPENLSLIYVNTPFEVCRQRDVKGLYRKAADGGVEKMTGMTSSFELPVKIALSLDAGNETLEQTVEKLVAFAQTKTVATLRF